VLQRINDALETGTGRTRLARPIRTVRTVACPASITERGSALASRNHPRQKIVQADSSMPIASQ
jgi:hypothetical protein